MTPTAPAIDRANHQVTWLPTRPEFAIRVIASGTPFSCYHVTDYEVVSKVTLDPDDFTRLDACGLLGSGQSYHVKSYELITDSVPPVTVDRRTGQALPDVPPVNHFGDLITQAHDYAYHRYVVERVCDSGD